MTAPNHYQILEIAETASTDEIRAAYRRLARIWHPDRSGGNPQAGIRFKLIAEAHSVLSHPERRAAYDRARLLRVAPPPSEKTEKPSVANRFGQFVGNVFYQFSATDQRSKARPHDLEAEVRIPFLVAVRGGMQTLTLRREVACERCQGGGGEPGTQTVSCPLCQGSGEIHVQHRGARERRQCHQCQGRGTLPRVLCRRCNGKTTVQVERSITVRIPPGTRSGTRLRIANEGELPKGGDLRGDLLVTIQVEPHPRWRVEGQDIHEEITIDLGLAVLGGTISITTVDGPTSLQIPPATGEGAVLRLREHGLRIADSDDRGDHVVHLHVQMPPTLSEEAKKRFAKFARAAGLTVQG